MQAFIKIKDVAWFSHACNYGHMVVHVIILSTGFLREHYGWKTIRQETHYYPLLQDLPLKMSDVNTTDKTIIYTIDV